MAGVALANPRIQFLDSSGNPLSGGFVHVYLAGTTTETDSWQDRAQTTLNTNPIVLDAAGACQIVLGTTLTYKIVVTDSAGVTQSHLGADNVVGAAGASFLADAIAAIEAQEATSIAAVAASGASVVQPYVDEATTQAGLAATAKTASEAARDAALAAGDIYADTVAGLAATASGGYFCVPSSETYEYLILYKDNAGVAEEVKRFTIPGTIASRSVAATDVGPAYAIKDVDGRNILMFDGAGDPVLAQNFFYQGLVRAGLDWTRLAIRAKEHHGTVFPAADWWGVHIVGQSNAAAANADPALSTTQPFSNLRLNPGSTALIPLVETAFESIATAAASHATQALLNDLPPWATFAQTWIYANEGASGSNLSLIDQGSTVYNQGLARVTATKSLATTAGKTYAERAMVLMHGENDSTEGILSRDDYKTGIIQFKDDWNTDVAVITGQTSRIPMFIVQMAASGSTDRATDEVFPIMQAMLDAAEEDDEVFVVFPGYATSFEDGLHYDEWGQRMIGEYVGKAMHRYFVEGRDPSTVRPIGHTLLTARTLEIEFFVPVPPLRFDLDRVWVSQNYGFRIYDAAGAEITVSNVYISDYNKVTIETSADMEAGDFYEYANRVPSNTANAGRQMGGRGNLIDSDRTLSYYPGEDGERYELPAPCAAFRKTI